MRRAVVSAAILALPLLLALSPTTGAVEICTGAGDACVYLGMSDAERSAFEKRERQTYEMRKEQARLHEEAHAKDRQADLDKTVEKDQNENGADALPASLAPCAPN